MFTKIIICPKMIIYFYKVCMYDVIYVNQKYVFKNYIYENMWYYMKYDIQVCTCTFIDKLHCCDVWCFSIYREWVSMCRTRVLCKYLAWYFWCHIYMYGKICVTNLLWTKICFEKSNVEKIVFLRKYIYIIGENIYIWEIMYFWRKVYFGRKYIFGGKIYIFCHGDGTIWCFYYEKWTVT